MNRFKKKGVLLAPVVAWMLIAAACSHYDDLKNGGEESTTNGHSHNTGADCMRCHNDGSNEIWWYVAGSAYLSNGSAASNGGTVQLWTGVRATGTLLYSLPIDHSGNFYTEKIIDFKGGYYPVVISGSDTFAMTEKVTSANLNKSCNNCHGHNGNGLNTPVITLQ